MTGLIIHKNQSNFVKKYQTAERKIKRILGNIAPIEHVGSTAVTGLDGKGIIDVLIGLENEKNIDEVESILIDNGYFGKKGRSKNHGLRFLGFVKSRNRAWRHTYSFGDNWQRKIRQLHTSTRLFAKTSRYLKNIFGFQIRDCQTIRL